MDIISSKARFAFQAVSSKAEWVISELKSDFKAAAEKLSSKSEEAVTTESPKAEIRGLPWCTDVESEKKFETELKKRILEISSKPDEYFLKDYDVELLVDINLLMPSAASVLEVDSELRKVRTKLVPGRISENQFWNRYFLAVEQIKHEVIDTSEGISDYSDSSSQREPVDYAVARLSSTPSLNMEKDDQEEKAYKDAYESVAIIPTAALKRLANAVSVARCMTSITEMTSLEDNAIDPALQLEKFKASIKQSVGAGIAVLGSLGRSDRESSSSLNGSDSGHGNDKKNLVKEVSEERKQRKRKDEVLELGMVLQALFARELVTDVKENYEEFVQQSAVERGGLIEAIHGAPPGGFVAELAETMSGLKNERKMALFWEMVVAELRRHWKEGKYIPLISTESNPDLRCCLLHQQLELINCCIARQKRRNLELSRLREEEEADSSNSNESVVTGAEGEGTGSDQNKRCARTETGEYVRRLGVDKPVSNLRLLMTGEVMYAPICQESPILTEVLIQEEEELIQKTGSSGTGYTHLLCDMQAFKAANPGCVLEDFVRWYSPLDWIGEKDVHETNQGNNGINGKTIANSEIIKGSLSPRMLAKGNVWLQLWDRSKPIPTISQPPLFDSELSAETVLNYLESMPPGDLFLQLFVSALGVGFSAAISTPQAASEPLSRTLKDCSDYVISHCSQEMSDTALSNLCQVYEIMESAVQTPPETEDDNFLKKLSQLFKPPWVAGDKPEGEKAADETPEPELEPAKLDDKTASPSFGKDPSKRFGFGDFFENKSWGRADGNRASRKWSKETENTWEEILHGSKKKSGSVSDIAGREKRSSSGSESDPGWTLI